MFLYEAGTTLAHDLDLDGSVESSGEGTRERAYGLDGATVTPNHLGDVALGDGHLNGGGTCTVDDLETHTVSIIDDVDDQILDQIGDAIGDELLALIELDGLVIEGLGESDPRTPLLLGGLSGGSSLFLGLTSSLLGLLGKLLLGLLGGGGGLLALVGGLHQSGDGVGELSALGLPVGDLLKVEGDGLGGGHGVVTANLLDGATIATGAGIGDDDAVVRALLGTMTSEAILTAMQTPSSAQLLAAFLTRTNTFAQRLDGKHLRPASCR